MWTENEVGNLPKVFSADNEYDEGKYIAEQIEHLRRKEKYKYSDFAVLYEISNAKNEMLEPMQYKVKYIGDFRKETIARIYELYQKKLKENNAIDFNDIINL